MCGRALVIVERRGGGVKRFDAAVHCAAISGSRQARRHLETALNGGLERMSTPEERLFDLWREIRDLDAAEALLSWDQETYMPPRGVGSRAGSLATLAGIKHARVTAPELCDALSACEETAEPGGELAAQVARARRRVDRAAKVPAELARALAEASSRGLAGWQAAREASDFGLFSADLAHLIDAAPVRRWPGTPPGSWWKGERPP